MVKYFRANTILTVADKNDIIYSHFKLYGVSLSVFKSTKTTSQDSDNSFSFPLKRVFGLFQNIL